MTNVPPFFRAVLSTKSANVTPRFTQISQTHYCEIKGDSMSFRTEGASLLRVCAVDLRLGGVAL